jgi:hypothetical protein
MHIAPSTGALTLACLFAAWAALVVFGHRS